MVCFIIENADLNVKLDGKQTNLKFRMSDSDIYTMESNVARLPETFKNLSKNKMNVDFDIIRIKEPLRTISYDEENEYYVAPNDIKELIDEYVKKEEYDYIYVAVRLGNINKNKEILVHDWIGLGGMDYYGIGFSNIRLPDSANNYTYKYDSQINTFPEEVFVHEFLHTLERNEKEYGNKDITALHSYEAYGYKTENLIGLKKWYAAYMQNNVKDANGTKVGLTEKIYTSKPIHNSNFKYSYELNLLDEPSNLLEEINCLIKRISLVLKREQVE